MGKVQKLDWTLMNPMTLMPYAWSMELPVQERNEHETDKQINCTAFVEQKQCYVNVRMILEEKK